MDSTFCSIGLLPAGVKPQDYVLMVKENDAGLRQGLKVLDVAALSPGGRNHLERARPPLPRERHATPWAQMFSNSVLLETRGTREVNIQEQHLNPSFSGHAGTEVHRRDLWRVPVRIFRIRWD